MWALHDPSPLLFRLLCGKPRDPLVGSAADGAVLPGSPLAGVPVSSRPRP
ncbi:hypothetical protein IB211_00646c [Intestinimonas butyriciproducens]|uniref:Uncharacterized protein n=1 Tax=Intestinimonas butyriciproducens TaxID=1297617 RepID=A0A0S2W123_9FIRM|nr:hypothetical protein IB211_00646c [Intestinimonas butyriciproducens]